MFFYLVSDSLMFLFYKTLEYDKILLINHLEILRIDMLNDSIIDRFMFML